MLGRQLTDGWEGEGGMGEGTCGDERGILSCIKWE